MEVVLRLGVPKVLNRGGIVLIYSKPVPIAIRIPKNAGIYTIHGGEHGIGILTEDGNVKLIGMSSEEAENLFKTLTEVMM